MERYERLALGYQMKKLRKKLKLKQMALARKLKTSQSAISRMEAGKQNFSLGLLAKIGFLLGKRLQIRFL
jgi:transcriptional regulator with XRE-family HTH domain